MPELTVKTIKGNKYLYIRDKVKVNSKSLPLQIYIGRLETVAREDVLSKLSVLHTLRLTTYLDYRLEHYSFTALDRTRAVDLETLHYFYGLFKELYPPDESERYVDAMYLRYVQARRRSRGGIPSVSGKRRNSWNITSLRPERRWMRCTRSSISSTSEDTSKGIPGDITEKLIRKIHEILMNEVLRDPGDYRNIQVGIERVDYEPPPAILVPEEMGALIGWYRQNKRHLNPFELAVVLHTKFEMIHRSSMETEGLDGR
ncbi:Fic family protein [Methanoculleus chikugoensis]|uniref:Fic family protein n=1 Tax=Methanoculleus chikugoensis TaxID=118126 RepID=UPI0006D0D909|nr:Fic family protein [Methanoculleus chikugoensis]